jgi:hypothetical protein
MQAELQAGSVEIHQKGDGELAVSKIGEGLDVMDGKKPLDSLQLDKYQVIHDEICTVGRLDVQVPELDGNGHFRSHLQSIHCHFLRQARAIRTLEKAGPQDPVRFVRAPQNALRELHMRIISLIHDDSTPRHAPKMTSKGAFPLRPLRFSASSAIPL